MTNSSYTCPQCGSEHTKSLSVIHSEGVTRGTATTYVKGHYVLHDLNIATDAATKAAPPKHRSLIFGYIVASVHYWVINDKIWLKCWIGAIVIGMINIPLLLESCFVGMVVYRFREYLSELKSTSIAINHNNRQLSKKLVDWSNSCDCQRCGHRFVAKEQLPGLGLDTTTLHLTGKW
jgi:DNA-directed RNA polymerase subunit RPC12/RpoP